MTSESLHKRVKKSIKALLKTLYNHFSLRKMHNFANERYKKTNKLNIDFI